MESEFGSYFYIDKDIDLVRLVNKIPLNTYISFDTENRGGLDPLANGVDILLYQIEYEGVAYVINALKTDSDLLKGILEEKTIIKTIQNAKHDWKMMKARRGIALSGIYDTMIAELLLTAGITAGHGLDALSKKYLDYTMSKETRESFFEHKGSDFSDEQIKYAAEDILVLPKIRKLQQKQLKHLGLSYIAGLEFALVPVVSNMELEGFKLDADKWRQTLSLIEKKIFSLSNQLRTSLPSPDPLPPKPVRLKKDGTPYKNTAKPKPDPVLNLNSWQQVAEAFNKIGVDLIAADKVTKKGVTNNSTLKYASVMYQKDPNKTEALNAFISYREVAQVDKTFGENLISNIHPFDGRIHASFDPMGTASGRFSSSKPNLQNIKKRGEDGRLLRSCFVPEQGYLFAMADYSQIELRIAAEMSQDSVMIALLNEEGDIHKLTASQMYGVPYDDVTKDLRRSAKTLNFGIVYGMQVNTLSDTLGCSKAEAKDHLEKYKNTYPQLMAWINNAGREAVMRGYARTLGGRYRWFPPIDPTDGKMLSFYERVGKNHPIQGTSADMTKLAMVRMYLPLKAIGANIVNTIHDELCVEAREDVAFEAAQILKHHMLAAGRKFLTKVPVLVDVKVRNVWWREDELPANATDNELGRQALLWVQ